jgi:hypothetical protein
MHALGGTWVAGAAWADPAGRGGGLPAEKKKTRARVAHTHRPASSTTQKTDAAPRPPSHRPITPKGAVALFVPAHTREAFFQV